MRTNQGMRFQSNQFERLHDALEKNSVYESSPNKLHEGFTYEKIMNLRPRNKSKEIEGDFRYQANSNIEKVMEKLYNRNPISTLKNEE